MCTFLYVLAFWCNAHYWTFGICCSNCLCFRRLYLLLLEKCCNLSCWHLNLLSHRWIDFQLEPIAFYHLLHLGSRGPFSLPIYFSFWFDRVHSANWRRIDRSAEMDCGRRIQFVKISLSVLVEGSDSCDFGQCTSCFWRASYIWCLD